MPPRTTRLVGALVAIAPGIATAERQSNAVSLTPHLGIVAESDLVDGGVQFSDGGVDFISVEPKAGLLVGVEVGLRLRPKLRGTLALSATFADARYDEDGTPRRDVDITTLRIQPGVVANLVRAGKTTVGLGGGLTLARISIDGMVWSGERIAPRATAIGLFGTAAIEVALSARIAFHGHLALELARPAYGDLEDELARADGEAFARVDHDARTAVTLAAGIAFAM